MPFNLDHWKQSLAQRLKDWKPRFERAGMNSIYYFIAGSALIPLAQAMATGDFGAFILLGSMLGQSVGTNLLANMVQNLKDKTEEEACEVVRDGLQADPKLQEALDGVLKELDAIQTAKNALKESDKAWFTETLQREMESLAKGQTIELHGNGAIALGDGATALGVGAVQMGDVKIENGDLVLGNQNKAVIDRMNGGTVIVGDHATIQMPGPDPQEQERKEKQAARQAYLNQLWKECQRLLLGPIGGDDSDRTQINLKDVYIDLNTTARVRLNKSGKKEILRSGEVSADKEETRPFTALEAVQMEPCLVLLGDPGSGKSSFVRHVLAWQARAMQGAYPGMEGIGTDLTPVLVTLRDLAVNLEGLEGLPEEKRREKLLRILRGQIRADLEKLGPEAARFAPDLLKDLEQGKALLVLDGLDEVAFDRRELARDAAVAALGAFQGARVIITCRIRSYTGAAVLSGYRPYTLAPFTEEQIEQFAKDWYLAQLKNNRIATEAAALDSAADLFKAAVALKDQELASNPMLLTSMAIVHQRQNKLPDQRVKLYDQVVDILAWRWRNHTLGNVIQNAELRRIIEDDENRRSILERIGYETHRASAGQKQEGQSTGDLDRFELMKILSDEEYFGSDRLAVEFIDYIDQHSGLLVGRGGKPGKPTAYGFPHRSLQEYLAGCYLLGQSNITGTLYAHADEGEGWDLAVCLGLEELYFNRRKMRKTLINLACDISARVSGTSSKNQRMRLWGGQAAALVGAKEFERCQDVPGGGAQGLARMREQMLGVMSGNLIPLERAEAGNALAALGDPRFREDFYDLPADENLDFVHIPAGEFWMGEDSKKHRVKLLDYYLAKYPVTVGQYRAFVESRGYTEAHPRSLEGISNHPVIAVTWFDAQAYCAWLTDMLRDDSLTPEWMRKILNEGGRIALPSEAEWERGARGTDGRIYPWEGDFDSDKANTEESGIHSTSAVGCFPNGTNPDKLEEMSGNALEWTRSLYRQYPYVATDGREDEADKKASRVLRGGSWYATQGYARCAYRYGNGPYDWLVNVGFRLALLPSLHSEL